MTSGTDATTRDLPDSLRLDRSGSVAVLTIDRPGSRNALDLDTVQGLGDFFTRPPDWVRAAVITATGPHFCAGLDLREMVAREAIEALHHSRTWHRSFAAMERGPVPVVSVLFGAVIGGGFELAAATHVRVAEPSAFYSLPAGQRGLFVGGGGSVRIPRLIGVARMADMMLTGRVLSAQEGHAAGVSQYLVDEGAGLATATALAERMAQNSPITNFGVLQALPRIADAGDDGFLFESLMAQAASSSPEAQQRMSDFLAGRAARVQAPGGSGGE